MQIKYLSFKQPSNQGMCIRGNGFGSSFGWYFSLLTLLAALCFVPAVASGEEELDLTDLPIESLLNMEVYSASKFNQSKTDAPTAVTVITSKDIKDYGYRTLADIVQSVRGVSVSSDRNYSTAGTRGFHIPEDVNTRVLVLLDGYRLNDALYDQGPLGTEFPVDVDLIERVEYLSGAGSAIYGNNAFFGVINVITKTGKDYKGKGVEVSGRVASYGTDQERVSYGKHYDSGLDVLISGTRHDSKGQRGLYFPEFDVSGMSNGTTSYGDYDNAQRLFGKFSWQHFTFESGYSKRNKGLPTGAYDTVFNDPRNQNSDQHAFFNFSYDNVIANHLELYARAYHGSYDYPGTWINNNSPDLVSKEHGLARWWGSEVRFISTHLDGHKLMVGGEFQDNYRLSDDFFNVGMANNPILRFDKSNSRYGIYIQDEMTLRDDLIFNAGVRYDSLSYSGNAINPRLALIYKPWNNTAFKLLYGSSFRAPNAYELYYNDPGILPSANLGPERIKTYEAIIEYQPSRTIRLTAVGFHYEINNLIHLQQMPGLNTNDAPTFQLMNAGTAAKVLESNVNKAWGSEFEVEKLWDSGSRLRSSYTWANAYDPSNNQQLINSPSSLFKLNFSTPLYERWLRAGAEAQYTSSRQGRDNTKTSGYPMFNLTLTSGEKLFKGPLNGLEISGSVYNLLDRDYASVASYQYTQHFIPQNGRNFRLVFSYQF